MDDFMNKTTGVGVGIIGIGVAMLTKGETPWYAGALVIALGAVVMTIRHAMLKNGRNTRAVEHLGPPAAALLVLGLLVGCTTTNYNIDFHNGAFRVADRLKIDPGQAGNDGSSTAGGPTAGGEDGSPGGSNVLDGFAQQGNIFQIGTAAKSDGEVRSNLQSNSSGSTDQGGDSGSDTDDVEATEPEPVE